MKQIYILKENTDSINEPKDLFKNIKKFKIDYTQENFIVFGLDTKHKIVYSDILFKGGLNSCVIDIKTIFKNLFLNDCNTFIISHNHPSTDLKPSLEDEQIFKKLKDCGELLDLKCIDSIIFNKDCFYSMNL